MIWRRLVGWWTGAPNDSNAPELDDSWLRFNLDVDALRAAIAGDDFMRERAGREPQAPPDDPLVQGPVAWVPALGYLVLCSRESKWGCLTTPPDADAFLQPSEFGDAIVAGVEHPTSRFWLRTTTPELRFEQLLALGEILTEEPPTSSEDLEL